MSRTPSPFSPVTIGRWDLSNRLVMAPLTRNRAGEGQAPTELNARYYGQRASAGLIITEGSQPSAVGQGYLDTPGVHSASQVEGWRGVAEAGTPQASDRCHPTAPCRPRTGRPSAWCAGRSRRPSFRPPARRRSIGAG